MTNRYQARVTTRPRTDDFWLDADAITEFNAETTMEVLSKVMEHMTDVHYIQFSKTAQKRKRPVYVDTQGAEPTQVGWTVIGSTELEFDNYQFKKRYVECWVVIDELKRPKF